MVDGEREKRTDSTTPVLAVLAASHGLNDLYTSFLAPLLPLVIPRFGLSLALAGLLQSALSLSSSVAQPLFGYITDRTGRVPFIALGPLITAAALSSVGLMPSYGALLAVLVVGGISSAFVHPQASSVVPQLTEERRGFAMALFIAGGTLGFAVGPVLVTTVVTRFGLSNSFYAVLPALVLFPFLWRYAPRRIEPIRETEGLDQLRKAELLQNAKPLLLLWFVVVCRSAVFNSFITFMPVVLNERAQSLVTGGLLIATFVAAGAAGTLVGGHITDLVSSRRHSIAALLLATIPVVIGAAMLKGWLLWMLAALAGALIEATNPMTVVLAHEAVPQHRGTASGLMMGFGWGIGGLLVAPVGALGDLVGIQQALTTAALLLLPATAAALALPKE